MNLSTIVYLGEKEPGNARTVGRLLQTMEDADNPAWWATYIYEAINKEQQSGVIEQPDMIQEICDRIEAIMKKQPNRKDVFVGSTDNRQPDVTCPSNLSNSIFREDNDYGGIIDLKKLWYWIYDNLVCHLSAKYEWLALLLFAKAHGLLKEDKTTEFCKQMSKWFDNKYTKQICSYNQVTTYQTGFFRINSFNYKQWVTGDGKLPSHWTPNNKDQKKEGYECIHRHCKWMEENFKFGDVFVIATNK